MKIETAIASASDEPALSRLMQLYAYDFSEFMGFEVGDDGLFDVGNRLTRSWTEPGHNVLWCRVDGRPAGFMIVDERSRITGDPEVMDMAQFFVMRKYRRQGVGAVCAAQAFDRYPKKWEIREEATNTAAATFWRRVVDRYTGGRFEETIYNDDRWHGPVQSFDARLQSGRPG